LIDSTAWNRVGAWIVRVSLIGVGTAFFLTPYIIAVHRLIILDEIAPSYVLRPGEPRFQKFFAWSLILLAGRIALVVVFELLSAFGVGASFIASGALIFTLCWAMARLSILFPAIAVDAAGVNWRNVMADTRGYAWQIFLIGLLASLLLALVELPLWATVGRGTIVGAITDSVISIVSITLLVVIASRLYQRLGNRVNQPAVA
jgi:hypothetical protein